MFGSVPLRTYLPDGDIDVTIICASGPPLPQSWAKTLLAHMRAAGAAADPPPRLPLHNAAVISADVELLKVAVDGVVVDISAQQLGACPRHSASPPCR